MAYKHNRVTRHQVFSHYEKGKEAVEVADLMGIPFAYVEHLYTRWNGTKRMDELKEHRCTYSIEPEQDEHKNILFKISQVKNFSNQFCLHTQDEKVKEAYHKMLTNRNTDIKS